MAITTKCLTTNCSGTFYSLGLCEACAKAARRMVARGESNWEELMQLGLVNEPMTGRRSQFFHDYQQKKKCAAQYKSGQQPPQSATIEIPQPTVVCGQAWAHV